MYSNQKSTNKTKNEPKVRLNQQLYVPEPDYTLPKKPPFGCKPKLLEVTASNDIRIVDPDLRITVPSAIRNTKQVSFAKNVEQLSYSAKRGVTFSTTKTLTSDSNFTKSYKSRDNTETDISVDTTQESS